MRGVILGNGVISGEDGKRYSYKLEDIQNLNGKTEANLEGCEVDFEIDDSKKSLSAKAIFITKSASVSVGNIFQDFSIPSIKMKAYIALGCGLFSPIPIVGWVLGIVSIVFLILTILNISKVSGSKELLRNYILYAVIAMIGAVVIGISEGGAALSFLAASSSSNPFGALFGGAIMFIIIGLLLIAFALFFAYKYYRELADLTQEEFFFYAFILKAVAAVTIPIFWVSVIVGIAAAVIEIIAWVRFKDIKKVA